MRPLPVALFGAVMGLAGLGLAGRVSVTVFPGLVRAPAYFTEPWILLAATALAAMMVLYLVKLVRHPAAVREDLTDPALLGFCGAPPVAMSLVAAGMAPYFPALADILWWLSVGLLLPLQAWALHRWLSARVALAQLHAGWIILLGGGLVLPIGGIALGHVEAARAAFGVSAVAAAGLTVALFCRALLSSPLPDELKPTWCVMLVAPSLAYANGVALYGPAALLEILFHFALALLAALLIFARRAVRWPVGPATWSFTFPLQALAYAAARYAQDHSDALWRWVAGAMLVLAAAVTVAVLLRTVSDAFRAR